MIRKIIKIDESKCNGCGACAAACHEGAIQMINGVAKLTREDYCDGLGDCLPACPTNAITIEEREAPAYDAVAVAKANRQQGSLACGCPGHQSKVLKHNFDENYKIQNIPSQLSQWPVQIKLVPVNVPYFQNADLLVAADCTAYAYGNFHQKFIKNHVTLVGCPKLDDTDYSEKLCEIIKNNDIKSITITRMVVPCCGGIENYVKLAIQKSGKNIDCKVVTISLEGEIIE